MYARGHSQSHYQIEKLTVYPIQFYKAGMVRVWVAGRSVFVTHEPYLSTLKIKDLYIVNHK